MHYIRPQLIEFVNCKNIRLTNVTLRNAACWVQTYDLCDNIILDHVQVDSDAYWNNDGIDIQDCKKVRITNCYINAADDGICLKSQSRDHFCDSIYIACLLYTSSDGQVEMTFMARDLAHGLARWYLMSAVSYTHLDVYKRQRLILMYLCLNTKQMASQFMQQKK